MSKAKGRKAVTARGDALLKLIAASKDGGLMLTQAEAMDAVKAGFAQVDTSKVEGEGDKQTAFVSLTDAGKAQIAPKAPAFEIDDGIAMPEVKKGGAQRGSKYPFDLLTKVGQSFHVPATAENPDPVAALASSLTGARRRYAEDVIENGQPVFETVKVKVYVHGPDGKRVKGSDGHWVTNGEETKSVKKTKLTRDFIAAAVGAEDPRGPGARVFRKL